MNKHSQEGKKPVTILTRNLLQQSYLKELCLHVYFWDRLLIGKPVYNEIPDHASFWYVQCRQWNNYNESIFRSHQRPTETCGILPMKISFKSSNKYSRVWYLGIACKAFDVSRLRNHCSRWHWCKNLFIHPNERQCRI